MFYRTEAQKSFSFFLYITCHIRNEANLLLFRWINCDIYFMLDINVIEYFVSLLMMRGAVSNFFGFNDF